MSDASIEEVHVRMENAKRELSRSEKLLQGDAVTKQQYDNVHTAYETAKARYEQASRAKMSISLVKNEQTHHLEQNEAGIHLVEAALELACLNFSYTVIIAPCDSTTGKKEILEGQLVQPGQTMADTVSSSDLWVITNYRETQLLNIKGGAEVKVTADTVPSVTFKEVIESVSSATGAALSMIPQDNATGSFIKAERHTPVRIGLRGSKPEDLKHMRAGSSVRREMKH